MPPCSLSWGYFVLGVISGARVVLGMINQADSSAMTWATGLLSALYVFLAHAMAGIGFAVFLQVLAGRLAHDVRPSPLFLPEAGHDLAAVAPDQTSKSSEASREDSVAEIRRSIRAGQWSEARLLLDDFADELPDDTRLSRWRKSYDQPAPRQSRAMRPSLTRRVRSTIQSGCSSCTKA